MGYRCHHCGTLFQNVGHASRGQLAISHVQLTKSWVIMPPLITNRKCFASDLVDKLRYSTLSTWRSLTQLFVETFSYIRFWTFSPYDIAYCLSSISDSQNNLFNLFFGFEINFLRDTIIQEMDCDRTLIFYSYVFVYTSCLVAIVVRSYITEWDLFYRNYWTCIEVKWPRIARVVTIVTANTE